MAPVKCPGCAKFLSTTEAAKCAKCKVLFHRICVSLPIRGQLPSDWHCPECNKSLQKNMVVPHSGLQSDDSSADEFVDSSPLEETLSNTCDLAIEFRLFRNELRAEFTSLHAEFRLLRSDVSQLKDSLKSCVDRVDSLEARISSLEKNNITSVRDSTKLDEIAQLRLELNDRDQELLENDLEIANVSEPNAENIIHTVKMLSNKLGVVIDDRDIVCANRIGTRYIDATTPGNGKDSRSRRIVVRLARRELRDELLRSARMRRGVTTADLDLPGPPRRFYINERLTKINRLLFRKVREAAQRHNWQFVWSKRGRILARKKQGESACIIRADPDIVHIFGPERET